jgi:hypothetical protein
MADSIQFLAGYLMFIILWVFILGLINENVDIETKITPPSFPIFSTNFIENAFALFEYFGGIMGFYFDLFTISPEATFISTFIVIPATFIAIFIFIKDILIPLITAIGSLIPFT